MFLTLIFIFVCEKCKFQSKIVFLQPSTFAMKIINNSFLLSLYKWKTWKQDRLGIIHGLDKCYIWGFLFLKNGMFYWISNFLRRKLTSRSKNRSLSRPSYKSTGAVVNWDTYYFNYWYKYIPNFNYGEFRIMWLNGAITYHISRYFKICEIFTWLYLAMRTCNIVTYNCIISSVGYLNKLVEICPQKLYNHGCFTNWPVLLRFEF